MKILQKLIEKQQYFFNISVYLWAAVVPSILNIVFNPFLAKALSAEDYAIIGYYTSFNMAILPIVCFSFSNYYSRFFFLKDEVERQKIKNTLVTSSLIISPLLTLLCVLIYLVYANVQIVTLPVLPYVILSFFSNFLVYYFNFYLNDLKLSNQPKKYLKLSLANTIILIVITIVLVLILNLGALGRFYSILISALLIAIYSIKKLISKFEFDVIIFRQCLQFSWPIILSSILFFLISGIDKLLLERIGDSYQFGLYNIAYQIVGFISILAIAVLQAFSPDIYRNCASKNYKKIAYISFVVFGFSILTCFAFIPFSKLLINLFTFNKFTESYVFADVLIFRNAAYVAFFLITDILIGLGLTKLDFSLKLISSILSWFIYKYAIFYYGFFGAAWSQSITLIIPVILLGLIFLLFKKRLV